MNHRAAVAALLLLAVSAPAFADQSSSWPAFDDSTFQGILRGRGGLQAPSAGDPRQFVADVRVVDGPGESSPEQPPHLDKAQPLEILVRLREISRQSGLAAPTDEQSERLLTALQDIDINYAFPISTTRWDAILKEMGDKAAAEYPQNKDWDKTIDDSINAGLKLLKDPHTDYWPPAETKEFNEQMIGSFVGIGVFASSAPAGVLVDTVFPKSPAKAAGLEDGDVILTADGVSLAGMPLDDAISKHLLGPRWSTVSLTVLRQGRRLGPLTVRRKAVPIPDHLAKMLPGGVGYIYLSQFGNSADKEVLSSAQGLRDQGARSLILDLRGDGGGSVHAVVEIASEFLRDGQEIVSFRHQNMLSEDYITDGDGEFAGTPLVVLIDKDSASGSEVMAAAMQDLHQNCLIIGMHSYGKGSEQITRRQPDDRTLHITINHNYRPNGQDIDARHDPKDGHEIWGTGGVQPNIEVDVTDKQEDGILGNIDQEMYGEPVKAPVDDPALRKALEVLGVSRM